MVDSANELSIISIPPLVSAYVPAKPGALPNRMVIGRCAQSARRSEDRRCTDARRSARHLVRQLDVGRLGEGCSLLIHTLKHSLP